MDLKYHSVDPFKLPLGDFLTSRGLLLADVDDVIVLVKNSPKDPDISALATKTLGDGVSIDSGNNAILFNFDYTDFGTGKLEAGKQYKIGIGIKTPALPKYLEATLSDNGLSILADFIHD